MSSAPIERQEEVSLLIRAKYPILYILSWEERRIKDILRAVAQERRKHLYGWTITDGLLPMDDFDGPPIDPATSHPLRALDFIAQSLEPAIFVLRDFHPFLDDQRGLPEYPMIVRRLRDLTEEFKRTNKTLIILSPLLRFPLELEKDITVLDYSLPTPKELEKSLDRVLKSVSEIGRVKLKLDEPTRENALRAVQGLTCTECENVLDRS